MQSVIASNPEASRGRLYSEEESKYRSPFQRDRDRVIHSKAFRRLKHKTQVFVAHEGTIFALGYLILLRLRKSPEQLQRH